MGSANKFLATKFEIPKPNFNLPIYLPTRISTQQILHECERNGDVRPGQFLLEVSATPILFMVSVMGLLFPLCNGAVSMTPRVVQICSCPLKLIN